MKYFFFLSLLLLLYIRLMAIKWKCKFNQHFSIFRSIFNHITVTHIILIYAFDVNVTLFQSTTISHMIVVLIFRSILWSTDLINFISFLRYSIAKISQFTNIWLIYMCIIRFENRVDAYKCFN